MNKEMNRNFKGIWIPKEIWLNNEINYMCKFLLAEIDSLSNTDEGCYAGNEYFSDLFGISVRQVRRYISLLKEKGYVVETKFDGRRRFLKSCIEVIVKADLNKSLKQPLTKVKSKDEDMDILMERKRMSPGGGRECPPINIYNNIDYINNENENFSKKKFSSENSDKSLSSEDKSSDSYIVEHEEGYANTRQLDISKKEYIVSIEDIRNDLGEEVYAYYKPAVKSILLMIDMGYKIERGKVKELIEWFKDKMSIYGYRLASGEYNWSGFTQLVYSWHDYHEGKGTKITNYKGSINTFLNNKVKRGY